MTLDDLMRKIVQIIPSAIIEEDERNGELVIYTDLRQAPSGELINFEED